MKRIAPTAAWSALWLTLLAIGLTFVPAGAQPADSGEFQLVARDLGVAHPPGYPLYTLAAHLFGRLVLAIPPLHRNGWPWAVNAFSMVLAVATLAVVFRTATRLGRSPVAGAIAALALACGPTFAAQALVANIRMATALFTALLLGFVVAWCDDERVARRPAEDGPPAPSRRLIALCLTLALAAGHHPTLAALALPLGLAIVLRRPAVLRDARLVAACVAAAVIGLLPLLYLPIRAAQHAPLAPSDLATWAGVWRHVTAAGFRGDMLAITGAQELGDRLLVLANILQLQFAPLALALTAIGAAWLVARRRAQAVALLGTTLIVGWLAITYRAPQTMEYLLPAYISLAIIAGAGASAFSHALFRRLRDLPFPQTWGTGSGGEGLLGRAAKPALAILAAAVFLALGLPMHGRAPALAVAAVPDLAAVTRLAADPDCLPEDATVLASWHFATPLWLAGHRTEGGDARDETRYAAASGAPLIYVHPDFATGDAIGETWRKKVDAIGARGSVVLTNRTREMIDARVPLLPVFGTPFWRRGAPVDKNRFCESERHIWIPIVVSTGPADDPIVIWEADVDATATGVDVAVTVLAPSPSGAAGVSMFAQLVDIDTGTVAGQADRPVDGGIVLTNSDGQPGYAVRLPIAPFRGIDPDHEYGLDVGLYRATPQGTERLTVNRVDTIDIPVTTIPHLRPSPHVVIAGTAVRLMVAEPAWDSQLSTRRLAASAGPLVAVNAIPFGNAMTLVAHRVARTPAALLVDLTWRADPLAPLSDYTVSVQAAADDASWHAQHDGTPALGAIPTLKWLPGMVIHDRHRIPLPPEAAGHDGPFTVTVGMYDAFSLEPLPVTDGDLVRQGQGQRAIIYSSR